MSDSLKPSFGTIGWVDLTVPNADEVRDFYQAVTGWNPEPVDMGGYSDFNMCADGGPVAGVCFKRGGNAQQPSVWMIYITVADLDASLRQCRERGGKVLIEPKGAGPQARYAVIEDPGGAVCSLYQPASSK